MTEKSKEETLRRKALRELKRGNPVAKHMHKYNKGKVFDDGKRKPKMEPYDRGKYSKDDYFPEPPEEDHL